MITYSLHGLVKDHVLHGKLEAHELGKRLALRVSGRTKDGLSETACKFDGGQCHKRTQDAKAADEVMEDWVPRRKQRAKTSL